MDTETRSLRTRAPGLPVVAGPAAEVLAGPPGLRSLHPDASVNFQLNRWLAWMTPAAVADVAGLAAQAPDYPRLTSGFLALAQRLRAEGRGLDAALCYRAGEFFLPPGDARRTPARRQFVDLIRDAYGIGPDQIAAVPFQHGTLPAYRIGSPQRGSVLLHGGFDSYIEELLPVLFVVAAAGYQAIGFDGPGQGGALEDSGLALTRDWHLPVGAVLDFFGVREATLVGVSLGGCLAIRAAAGEPRVTRVVADDVMTDFLACNLRQLSATARMLVPALLGLHAHRLLDAAVRRRMRQDLMAAWGISQGQHVFGVGTPHEYLAQTARYITGDVSARVSADVLLLAGAEDHYVPLTQLGDQITTLTHARSVTARVFTRAEYAHTHCQTGNIALSIRVILDWLDGLDQRG